MRIMKNTTDVFGVYEFISDVQSYLDLELVEIGAGVTIENVILHKMGTKYRGYSKSLKLSL